MVEASAALETRLLETRAQGGEPRRAGPDMSGRWKIIWLPVAAWFALTRRLDLQLLWPACRIEAYARRDALQRQHIDWLDAARAAFAVHAMSDAGWRWLGEEEITRRIDKLR